MSARTEAAFHAARHAYTPGGDQEELAAAARAHVGDSRPLPDLLAEFAAANSALHAGDPGADPDACEALAGELAGVRQATAIAAGSYPGVPPVITAGEGA